MKKLKIIIALFTFFLAIIPLNAKNLSLDQKQSKKIFSIIKKERTTDNIRKIINIINYIDKVYSNLDKNIKNGGKITIFFDPAHGKLPDGRWQGGAATRRLSCTNLPEEFYSINISRAIYKLLKQNKFIEVKTTNDFNEVLEGRSNIYNNIPFPTTVALAKKHGAFMIIAEHLNNVSVFNKADGTTNISGLHIIKNSWGTRYLKYIPSPYQGFLTLYNKFDASGFSHKYAITLKRILKQKGLTPNGWELGAVGDDRFSYFMDFPISVIFESGFIYNPIEEKKLKNPEYIEKIVTSQYQALLENIKNYFGIDISNNKLKVSKNLQQKKILAMNIELLKLARITIFFLKNGYYNKSVSLINYMERKFRNKIFKNKINYYRRIKLSLIRSHRYYRIANKYLKKFYKYKKRRYRYSKRRRVYRRYRKRYYRLYRKYLRKSRNSIIRTPVLYTYKMKLFHPNSKWVKRKIYRKIIIANKKTKKCKPYIAKMKKPEKLILAKKSNLSKPIILTIDRQGDIKQSLLKALAPDPYTLKYLVKIFKKAKITTYKRRRYYSRRRRRYVRRRVRYTKKIKFRRGIYIVKLNRRFRIVSLKKVSTIRLNSRKYQNQEYLKNSYFAKEYIKKEL